MLGIGEKFVIEADGDFLIVPPYTWTMWNAAWSRSVYDAIRYTRRSTAKKVARIVGGRVMIFNELTGDIRNG